MQWLLAEGGATIGELNNAGQGLWTRLCTGLTAPALNNANVAVDVSSFLRIALLLDGPPATFRLSREHQLLVIQGNRIRAALPRFLERRRVLVLRHCPLIPPLIALVLRLSEPDNAEIWAAGIGEPRRRRRAVSDASVPLRQSLRLKQQRRE